LTATNENLPMQPLPHPLLVSDDGSFAQHTVRYRLPRFARQVIESSVFSSEINQSLQALIAELPFGRLRPIRQDGGPDVEQWEHYLQPYLGRRWADVPWFLAELYFYRRLLEATGYFGGGPTNGLDPFAAEKRAALLNALPAVGGLASYVHSKQTNNKSLQPDVLTTLLQYALWGNRVDLTLFTASKQAHGMHHLQLVDEKDNIICDQTNKVVECLQQVGANSTIQLVADNAGFESFCDLVLVDYLLSKDIASVVRLHLKTHPVFVSDAMIRDVHWTIDTLRDDSDPNVRSLGTRLQKWVDECRLQFDHHLFWTSPLPQWQMPDNLKRQLATSDLVIFKGDANYRRLLGDLHWPLTHSFSNIVSYFPSPVLALRTFKSEVGAGLPEAAVERLSTTGTDWMVKGDYGVIQFALPPSEPT
jgi:uncharacterized protein with ATP-grasp and redox domains